MSVLATLALAACSVDDTPQLTSTVAPVLSELTSDTIAEDKVDSMYTFNWTAARFYMDNNESSTSIGSFNDQGVNYDLQIDTLGGDFSSSVSVAQVVSKLFLNVTQKDVGKVLANSFGITPDIPSVDVMFRIVARYSGVNSLTLVSNTIESTWKAGPYIPTTPPKFYIHDNAGWGDMTLYAWNETGNMMPWPGVHYSYTLPLNGIDYNVFDMPSDYVGRSGLNFIANNNNGGLQVDLLGNYTFSSDVYITVNGDGTYTVDPTPQPTLFVRNYSPMVDFYFYVWADAGDVKDGWPGVRYSQTVEINGETWYAFNMDKAYSDTVGNWIINDNGANQYNLMSDFALSQNVFVTLNADGTFTTSDNP